ncbi:MAG: type II secretion system protein [Planctomycetota bacterium]
MLMRPARTRNAAFTLIELLVVIGIIAVLVAILVPVLGNARDAGKAAVCLSNLRSLSQATLAYSADYRQRVPQPGNENSLSTQQQRDALWFNALDPYLGQVVSDGTAADRNYDTYKQDPVYLELPVDPVDGQSNDQTDVRTIKMNVFFGHDPIPGLDPTAELGPKAGDAVAFYKLTDVSQASETVLYADGRGHDTPNADGGVDADDFAMNETYLGLRHGDGANLGFVDGSSSYQENPIRLTENTEYRVWYRRYADRDNFTEEDRAVWPEAIFNFRPESFANGSGEPVAQRY